MKDRHRSTAWTWAGVAVLILGIYGLGFLLFHRFHWGTYSMRTGELCYTVPDTIIYRAYGALYLPLLALTDERLIYEK